MLSALLCLVLKGLVGQSARPEEDNIVLWLGLGMFFRLLCCDLKWVNKPTAVHVSRPVEVEKKRKDLPIIMMEQEIIEAINEQSTVIICGETGCGKTTQVPQFLYEAGFGSKHSVVRNGVIGVTQPRRVAVLATARRVAFELGLHLGKEVGFQVRHDKRIGDDCSIKLMTDGILLREVQVALHGVMIQRRKVQQWIFNHLAWAMGSIKPMKNWRAIS